MEHFEDTWNKAEEVGESLEDDHNVLQNIHAIQKHLDLFLKTTVLEKRNEHYGEMLFQMCQISRKVPINSSALLKQITNAKEMKDLKSLDESLQKVLEKKRT